MKHLSSLFILLHLPAIECLAGDKQDWTTNTLAPGLTIQMPPRFRMTRRRPTGDFDLIVFKKDSRTVLTVYVGNQPEFPREKVRCSIKEATINGLRTESTIIKRPDLLAPPPQFELNVHLALFRAYDAETGRWLNGIRLENSAESTFTVTWAIIP